ncbi:glutamate mutase L [Desulfovibrio aminophilus]|uniref:glutamate mutase L n=1 Tax=Desulfovibrio aminophilus TaxID=81425 RepID=UPI0033985472
MNDAELLVFDVGSTYTKLSAFCFKADALGGALRYVGRAQAATTVQDIEAGLAMAENTLRESGVHILPGAKRYASSSAAGGLRMVALGYMPRVTVKAAKEVAMNAGARVLEVLSCDDSSAYRVEVLREIRPDIVLLTGGTDGGDSESLAENSRVVTEAVRSVNRPGGSLQPWEPVIILAGNREGQGAASEVLQQAEIRFLRVPNILPTIHELRVQPAREAIHGQFIRQITKAPGLGRLIELVEGGKVIPTPGAVLLGAELLAKGTHSGAGAGNLMVVDLGGATTDIHSVIPDLEALAIEERGLVVSHEKQVSYRTVEGNLGMRVSACGIVETLGARGVLAYGDPEAFASALGLERMTPETWAGLEERLSRFAENLEAHPETVVPENGGLEAAFDTAMATAAVAVALRRHAGHIAAECNPVLGITPGMPIGRDTRMITTVFAVGGIFAHSSPARSKWILERAFSNPGLSLLPREPSFFIDKHYLLYALGVLGDRYADAVLAFGKRHFGLSSAGSCLPTDTAMEK